MRMRLERARNVVNTTTRWLAGLKPTVTRRVRVEELELAYSDLTTALAMFACAHTRWHVFETDADATDVHWCLDCGAMRFGLDLVKLGATGEHTPTDWLCVGDMPESQR